MMKTNKTDTEEVADLIDNAWTLEEVQTATHALRQWAERHPEHKGRLSELFESLFRKEEAAREEQAEAEAMGLTPAEQEERRHVHQMVVRARTLEEIVQSKETLLTWAKAHPDDPQTGIQMELLSNQEEVERLLREPVSHTPVLAK